MSLQSSLFVFPQFFEVPVTYVPENTADTSGADTSAIEVPVNPVFDATSYGDQISAATDQVTASLASTTFEFPEPDTSGFETANAAVEETKAAIEGMGDLEMPDLSAGTSGLNDLQTSITDTTAGLGDLESELSGLSSELAGLDLSLAEHNTVWNHWRVPEGMTADEVRKKEADAEVYMCSVNGVSEKGELVNIDGTGNRVASNLWGHKKWYFVIGTNKIVPTLADALERARTVAGPLNAKRLGLDTPCVKLGHCIDCNSPHRICNGASIVYRPMGRGDMEIVLIGEELGY